MSAPDQSPNSQGNIPDTPPPTYSESTALKVSPPRQAERPAPGSSSSFGVPGVFPVQPAMGPTPLAPGGPTVLPYYDPRSPYSLAEARVRARRRFFWALLMALALFALGGGFTGTAIHEAQRRR